jgi:hypothetical protein
MLRAFELEERYLDPNDPWNEFLQACNYGIRSTYHITLQASPGQVVFGRDIIHDVPSQAFFLKKSKQIKLKVLKNLIREKILIQLNINIKLTIASFCVSLVYDVNYRHPRRACILYYMLQKMERLKYNAVM